MPWLTSRELKRLERELSAALRRAVDAEKRLDAERSSKDWAILQLTSRFVTKQGGYALDTEPPAKIEPNKGHPKGYTHEPTEIDYAKLEFYKRCAVEAGHDESDAERRWEAEMRGEGLPIEYEAEQ